MKVTRQAILVILTLAVWASPSLAQEERILDFKSHVTVRDDGSLLVREVITINTGPSTEYGIYRGHTIHDADRHGSDTLIDFRPIRIMKDGHPEPFEMKDAFACKRLYIGNAEEPQAHGPHTYDFTYETDPQVRQDDGLNELYWNASGAWVFPIDSVSAEVALPDGAEVVETYAWLGDYGPKGENDMGKGVSSGVRDGLLLFKTDRPLGVREGLSLAVVWRQTEDK